MHMLLALIAVIVGLVAGLATRGSLAALRDFRPLFWWAPLAAAVLYVIPLLVDDLGGENVLAAMSLLVLIAAAVMNHQIAGLGVVAIGLGLNLVPLAIDGATTVGPDAAATVELDTTEDLGVARRIEVEDDRVGLLGDRIPIPGLDWLVSFGDLIVLVGLVDVGLRLTRPRHGSEVADPEETGAEAAATADAVAKDDPWFALVRGDHSQDHLAERAPASMVDEHGTGEIRLSEGTSGEHDDVVPYVDTSASRPDELDLSLVRWADEPPPDEADTDELDLRDLQSLLEHDSAPSAAPAPAPAAPSAAPAQPTVDPASQASPVPAPAATPEPTGPATPPPPEPSKQDTGGFGDTLARFDREHDVLDLDVASDTDAAGPRAD